MMERTDHDVLGRKIPLDSLCLSAVNTLMFSKDTLNMAHQLVQGLDRFDGLHIETTLAELRKQSIDMEQALDVICAKRGCSAEKYTPGDNAPVRLLKATIAELRETTSEIATVEYVVLRDVLDLLHRMGQGAKG